MINLVLPSGWAQIRLKHLATYNDDVLPENTDEDREIDYVEISGVSLSRGIEEIKRMPFGKAPSRARRKVCGGDILISTVRTYLRAIATVETASPNMIASTGFCVVRPGGGVDNSFLGWAVKANSFVSEVVARSVGVSYPAIKASELVTIFVPLPPLDTQRRIARFLDEKTMQIDGLIEKKRDLLDRLAEKRQAIITLAVTKGLNPDANGMRPHVWETWKLSHAFPRISSGTTPTSGDTRYYTSSGGTPWVTTAELRENYILNTEKQVTQEALSDFSSLRLYAPNSVMMAMYGATIGRLGMTKIAATCNQACGVFERSECFDNRFLFYWLWHRRDELIALSLGGAQPNLSQQILREELALCPPLGTQRRIVRFLDETTARIDTIADRVRRSIGYLREYRAGLITVAVTGQIAELR